MYIGEEVTIDELHRYFKIAENYASLFSDDSETKVGALLKAPTYEFVRKAANTFISGAKGLPSTRPDKYEYIIHAEVNLITQAAAAGVATEGMAVICTLSPCQNCIRTLFQAGVREIYYKDVYREYNPNIRDIEITETKIGQYTKMVLTNYNERV